MRKKITKILYLGILFSIGLGYVFGRFYSCFHPMKDIEGYWAVNHDFNNLTENYHVCSRVSIIGREVKSSADVYGSDGYVKARRNIAFNVVDVKANIFIGKILSLTIIEGENRYLDDLLNTPYAVSHPIFYRLNEDMMLIEQSEGHPVNNLRLLTRNDI
ncbi:hypothetical protein CH54_3468 [Yersinia rochesterensis]|uniref:Uncharacterized protein n=3 Tax=Yersinia rochesterensis TaxID=1604335 RepID=A0A386HI16_9GAMM|nr:MULTISPECIES: hypothetical protein [Yersinia]AJI86221.1 hypothetical protein AW19_2318 [Yersinia frederiksenii Y225]CNH79671.1 Uncharacterised protein [Yersinia kristensenii]AIN18300.1 hypothetical protein DJ57_285 [Yersinia rochesterensis]AJJ35555.1 hypothetical protein CH54_3468 [Yersinia rochesterensis]AYD45044.1 hypothetical protein DXZ79_15870 [Yersinia rochesterensis]